jgi:glycine/D-amino acid oxidase-like deaminating enzyme
MPDTSSAAQQRLPDETGPAGTRPSPEPGLRVLVVGAGIAGLSAAFYLAGRDGIHVTVYEQDRVFGGRANVVDGAEHCPRVFLSDYERLLGILGEIALPDGRTVLECLRPLRRVSRSAQGEWIELSHLYKFLAREVNWVEKIRLIRDARRRPLLASESGERWRARQLLARNYSTRTVLQVLVSMFKSRSAYVLPGPTDEYLTTPWVRHLRTMGVVLREDSGVTAIRSDPRGVTVEVGGRVERFEAVVVAAFAPDAARILAASGVAHSLDNGLSHVHRKVWTIALDPAEPVLTAGGAGLYCDDGINILVQPEHRRCVVLCSRRMDTDDAWLTGRVREILALRHPLVGVGVRANQQPNEAVFAADGHPRRKIVKGGLPHVYFAGSHIRTRYPVDSGEAATCTAYEAVAELERLEAVTVGLPSQRGPRRSARSGGGPRMTGARGGN